MNDVLALLKSHRSIRRFTAGRVPDETVAEIISAGQCASTSSNMQAYTIIRVEDENRRQTVAELCAGQVQILQCSLFLVFCADLHRIEQVCSMQGEEVPTGYTESLLIATVDTAIVGQSVMIAAESLGFGCCYIGAVRNHPAELCELLELPAGVYPVFGLCVGYPDEEPELKPRLPLPVILKTDAYDDGADMETIQEYDRTMREYYIRRTTGAKDDTWSGTVHKQMNKNLRPHMRDFLARQGFELK